MKALELCRSQLAERLDRLPQQVFGFPWQIRQRLEREPTRHFHLDHGLEPLLVEPFVLDTPAFLAAAR